MGQAAYDRNFYVLVRDCNLRIHFCKNRKCAAAAIYFPGNCICFILVAPAPEVADKSPVVEPLAPARYRVQFTASAELHDKPQRLAALMPGADLASMLEASVTEKHGGDGLRQRQNGAVQTYRRPGR